MGHLHRHEFSAVGAPLGHILRWPISTYYLWHSGFQFAFFSRRIRCFVGQAFKIIFEHWLTERLADVHDIAR